MIVADNAPHPDGRCSICGSEPQAFTGRCPYYLRHEAKVAAEIAELLDRDIVTYGEPDAS